VALTPSGRLVAVTRDGALDGDQLFLLYFLRWLTGATQVEPDVLTWHEGILTGDLREISPVRAVEELDRWRPARVFEVLRIRRVAQALKGLRLRWWLLRRSRADVLYVNGLAAGRILGYLSRWSPPVVVHVHDLGELDDPGLSDADRAVLAARTDRFVAASDDVARRLVDRLGVPEGRVARHDHFVAGVDLLPPSTERPTRAQLGIGDDELVVGGIGTADWWAAADQFVLLAWALRRAHPELAVRYLWIAGDEQERVLWPLRHDLANAGVDDVTTVGVGWRPLDYLAVMDVLVLATRVESQELIALEAAASDIVVVATDNLARTGAVADLALVVPYLDTDALVEAVATALTDAPTRAAQVDRARAEARRHHDVSVGGPTLLDLLGSVR
jgi:glycosyltransferase involved in cell wall biosynthesis